MFVDFFIRRPVFATVCALLIILGGAISIPSLPVAQFPQLAPPQVIVTAFYIGANAQTVESAVTIPLEQNINGVPGMRYITSSSGNDGSCFITVTFESTRVEHRSSTLMVDGRLSLHGVTKPVSIEVHVENGRYTGRFQLKQRDFDITPISIAGGTVKVKDELEIEFDIATLPGERGN